ncbi:MAG: hypothetical protein ABIQ93_14570 [Saprospiraceae bacterium]
MLSTAFHLTDLTGRLVLEQAAEPGLEHQVLDAGNLPPGLYFLEVLSEGRLLAIEKFVKEE